MCAASSRNKKLKGRESDRALAKWAADYGDGPPPTCPLCSEDEAVMQIDDLQFYCYSCREAFMPPDDSDGEIWTPLGWQKSAVKTPERPSVPPSPTALREEDKTQHAV